MEPAIGWLAVFVVICLASLWWAASELARQKVYNHNSIAYPTNLEFNSSLTFLFTIVVTIVTSVVVGYLVAKYIQPDDNGTPKIATTVVVVLIWLAALAINTRLFMRAKVVHLTWPDSKDIDKVYPVSIASAIAISTLLTLSVATMASTVVAILITQIIKAY